jgi:RNA polymerase sigma-70 factor (ECF subfamily)
LVRAKRRIAALGIPFAVPDRAALPDRLAHVLGAIFAAFAVGRDGGGWSDDGTVGLDTEAVALARLVVELMPDEPEARSLLALLLYATARAAAGRDAAGRFIPLDDQDPALWDRARITEAERHLINAVAGAAGAPGRFQIEAAIQSVHASRRPGEAIPWAALVGLYDILLARWPSVGAAVARLAALARLDPPEAVLVQVQTLMHGLPAPYQPAIALEADLLRRLGRHGEAGEASRRAAALALDPAVRAWLLARVPAAT